MKRILLLALCWIFCLQACSASAPVQYKIKVVAEYNHDTSAYTQGLFFDGGTLYESTGQCGESSFRVVDYKSGKVLRKLDFARKYFGEGSVFFKGKLYMLTWTNKVAFTYDAGSLKYIKTYSYPREGWGLTTDGKSLIASDGSSTLYFMDENLKVKRSLKVTMDGRPVRFLNELFPFGHFHCVAAVGGHSGAMERGNASAGMDVGSGAVDGPDGRVDE